MQESRCLNWPIGENFHRGKLGVRSDHTRRRLENDFYRAMLCIRGTSNGPVSVCLSQAGVLLKGQNV